MQKMTFGIALALLVTTANLPAADMQVIGNRVNLRTRPDLQAEVVGQVNRGDQLAVRSISGDWAEVAPPASIEFWVHSDFIEGGEVTPPRLNVRAGPSINYSVVAVIERGFQVQQTGSYGEWLSIRPPDAASVWITRDLLEPLTPDGAALMAPTSSPIGKGAQPLPEEPVVQQPIAPPVEPVETQPVAEMPVMEPAPEPSVVMPEPVVPEPVVQRPAPPPPRDLPLIPLEGQGEWVELSGVLRPAGFFFGRPSRYRLTTSEGHAIKTICFVRGEANQMESLLGRSLQINGYQYWVQGARHPVLVPEQIFLQ